ncbi:STAS domain-containing protein [Streptomyces meridianus]|uniref:STAS domain-containing protein n=1 Tax=Streptomyces meridianus TaxID=2938945 RepID=A0ABT0X4D6_9ACTN|nr:STAS domain-containing protein [Streptomyces meridianus]MCM2576768.1 STAS domain-containing protein [Streptomyces meridianus]
MRPDATVVTHTAADTHAVIAIAGEVDCDAAPAVETAVAEAHRSGVRRLVLDLARTTFADSSFLHIVLTARQHHELLVAGPLHPAVQRLFDVTGTTPHLRITDGLDEALGG